MQTIMVHVIICLFVFHLFIICHEYKLMCQILDETFQRKYICNRGRAYLYHHMSKLGKWCWQEGHYFPSAEEIINKYLAGKINGNTEKMMIWVALPVFFCHQCSLYTTQRYQALDLGQQCRMFWFMANLPESWIYLLADTLLCLFCQQLNIYKKCRDIARFYAMVEYRSPK